MKANPVYITSIVFLLCLLQARSTVLYVDLASPAPTPPYTNWSSAATSIQDAIDAAAPGDTVLVTNGIYRTGGRVVSGTLTNRVVVDKALTLQSVNGPEVTVIEGYQVPGTTNGDSAVRCVYVSDKAWLMGFTLTNGGTLQAGPGHSPALLSGGGVFCLSTDAVLSNCMLVANSAAWTVDFPDFVGGGGAFRGTLQHCLIGGNTAHKGGGVYDSSLSDCQVSSNRAALQGGGAFSSSLIFPTVTNCTFADNAAGDSGGAFYGTPYYPTSPVRLSHCTFAGNHTATNGGAVAFSYWNSASVDSCTFSNNSAGANGGAFYGTTNPMIGLINCAFYGNSAGNSGGATYYALLTNGCLSGNQATLGGASYAGTLARCLVSTNSASSGGGTYNATLLNCVVAGNTAKNGGGVYNGNLTNCTVVVNSATNQGGGGYFTVYGRVYNSIFYYNTAPGFATSNYIGGDFHHSCSRPDPPAPTDQRNLTNEPAFINLATGNLRLQTNSPCIDTGYNGAALSLTDLDGRPRLVGFKVDMGAYEFQGPGVGEFTAWLQQYGLPTDGSADFLDTDSDGLNNWQERQAGTDPTNALSVLQLLLPAADVSGITLSWQSVSGKNYSLERSTNLTASPAFLPLQSGLPGQAGITTFTDTSATNSGPYFYRVAVQ